MTLTLLLSVALAQVSKEPKLIPLCTLLKQGYAQNGQLVAFEAPVSGVTSFGMVAVGENCEERVKAGGYDFPSIVLIIASGPPNRLTSLRIPFATNRVFVDLGDRLVEAERTAKQLVCRIEGLFETRPTDTLWNARTNWPRGFGPLNLAPAQLVLKATKGCWLRDKVADYGPVMPPIPPQ